MERTIEAQIQGPLASMDRSSIAFPGNPAGQYEKVYNAAAARALGMGSWIANW